MSSLEAVKAQLNAQEEWYIELADGSRWYPGRDNNHFDIRVLAHGLSNLCRFTGHCREFYSVAEHSVKVSFLIEEYDGLAREGLLHDAHEALTNDLSKPVKMFIGGTYDALEEKAEREVRTYFGLPETIHPDVKTADIYMAIIEADSLLPSRGRNWTYYDKFREPALALAEAVPYLKPHCWSPARAKDAYLEAWDLLDARK